jgi:predicted dithiol-disulfide oxidoreductase (DUF899 family)
MPWEKLDKEYLFDTESGSQGLSGLFNGKSQLIVYHFMFGPDWEEGCPSCSFWADNYDKIVIHLNQRDISLVAISRSPLKKLLAYKKRMDWTVDWVSSLESDFNQDYQVSFTKEQLDQGEIYYNYHMTSFPSTEAPGLSVFYKDENDDIYHTYSCYARGLDMLNNAYHLMDLTPKGRDEDALSFPMAWVRRHDSY